MVPPLRVLVGVCYLLTNDGCVFGRLTVLHDPCSCYFPLGVLLFETLTQMLAGGRKVLQTRTGLTCCNHPVGRTCRQHWQPVAASSRAASAAGPQQHPMEATAATTAAMALAVLAAAATAVSNSSSSSKPASGRGRSRRRWTLPWTVMTKETVSSKQRRRGARQQQARMQRRGCCSGQPQLWWLGSEQQQQEEPGGVMT